MENVEKNITVLNRFIKRILNSNDCNNLLFLTMRFRELYYDKEYAREKLKTILECIFYKFLGKNWKNKQLKSFYVIEKGKSGRQHVHFIINLENRTVERFKNCLDKVIKQCPWCNLCYDFIEFDDDVINWSPGKNHLLIKPVSDITGLINYMLKELNLDSNHVNFDNCYLNNMFME